MRDAQDPGGGTPSARPGTRNLRALRHLWGYLRPYRTRIAGAVVALTVAAGTVLALGRGLRTLVDRGFAQGNAALLDQALMVLVAVVAVLAAASFARSYLVAWLGERVVADVRRDVFDHVIALSPGFFETTRTGEVLSRLTTDTTLLQLVVGTSVPIALRNLLMIAGGTVLLIVTSPTLTAIVFLVTPLVLVPVLVFGRRVRRLSRASQDRIADVGVYVDESLSNIRTVHAFNHEPVDRAHFRERVEDAFAAAIGRSRARALLSAVVIMLVFSAIAVVLWVGGHAVLDGRMTAGQLAAFVFYAVVIASSVGALSEVVGDLQRAAGATERLLDLLHTPVAIDAPRHPTPLPEPPRGALGFEHIDFRYPARPDAPALADFSLDVRPGETVALVGPSGAGKTTVFHLLLRFYDPEGGTVRLDGVDLRAADPRAVRARLGLVPQEPVIFSADARENIRYGNPDADDAAVLAAAEAAGARAFLEELPDGLATHLGERGVRLSGGQRQRIAIARAILRDPTVLLLDEATSALDSESERAVQAGIDRLMAGRTTLIIAHRLATVLKADRIVVMDRGRIVESGTHRELMARNGLYAHLAAMQFQAEPAAQTETAAGTV
ncbi:ATP-binding cassette, subfamily B [Limimonas halophila]|uniref:ATP-binding cassette, subfamily B n=1 Tax=Limimonas halophila TaxID=1082479 RepID=A0A1G7LSM8_9PROT|nr:ABC transporter transmembrane domain-containing protein [Limimonas halophila]SDF51969.1 ATP-binding cassette, subfamily B [Limimonas halophila]